MKSIGLCSARRHGAQVSYQKWTMGVTPTILSSNEVLVKACSIYGLKIGIAAFSYMGRVKRVDSTMHTKIRLRLYIRTTNESKSNETVH